MVTDLVTFVIDVTWVRIEIAVFCLLVDAKYPNLVEISFYKKALYPHDTAPKTCLWLVFIFQNLINSPDHNHRSARKRIA